MKIFLNSDWLKAGNFPGNTVQKEKYSARKVNTMQYFFLICFKIMFD